jgi:hypothetical protein
MIHSAYSEHTDPDKAADELSSALGPEQPKLLLFFASSQRDPAATAAAVRRAFPSTLSFGCTTAGELTRGRMLKGSIVAMALYDDDLHDAHAVFISDPTDEACCKAALGALEERFGSLARLDPTTHVGLILQDGMRGTEEAVMTALSSVSNVPFVGGSAGDDGTFQQTHGFLDGRALGGAAVVAMLRPARPFSLLKTQSFDVRSTTLVATDVDEASRTVRMFDGKPASEAYAAALDVPVAALPEYFMRHPLGLVLAGGEPFVRSPQQVRGTDVVFYCSVKNGMRLNVLDSRDIVRDTQRDLERALAAMTHCSGIINFHCILRTIELTAKGQCDAYGALFDNLPTVGFSTYGESYIGHINQTSTMLLLG